MVTLSQTVHPWTGPHVQHLQETEKLGNHVPSLSSSLKSTLHRPTLGLCWWPRVEDRGRSEETVPYRLWEDPAVKDSLALRPWKWMLQASGLGRSILLLRSLAAKPSFSTICWKGIFEKFLADQRAEAATSVTNFIFIGLTGGRRNTNGH